jgi:hypothetical protein
MSMIARFVQISPGLLTELIEDPDQVGEIFMEAAVSPRGAAQFSEALRAHALRTTPQMLGATLDRLDPRIRANLEARLKTLGTSLDDLRSGKGAEALANLMQRGLGALAASRPPSSPPSGPSLKGKGADISLDKAWHGVHYLLCGETEPGATILSQAVLGGTEIGDDDSGYGPARYFSPKQVADTAREFSGANLETEMKARFDPRRMNDLGIYPQGWDTAGALDWVVDEFHRVRDFYADATARQFAIVTCLI